jgi:two-component system chemotaxis response regulator CheB
LIMREPARVFVIDPNPLARKILGEVLSARPELVFLGSAATPGIAARRCAGLAPDVFVFDFEVPADDSLSGLQALRRAHPIPVVLYTSLDPSGLARIESHAALAESAVLKKPEMRLAEGIRQNAQILCDAITRLFLTYRMARRDKAREEDGPAGVDARAVETSFSGVDVSQWVIAIGASTGGTQAVLRLLQTLPVSAPGIVVVRGEWRARSVEGRSAGRPQGQWPPSIRGCSVPIGSPMRPHAGHRRAAHRHGRGWSRRASGDPQGGRTHARAG